MKKLFLSLAIVSATVLMTLSLQGCVVPYQEGGDRGDHRGFGRGAWGPPAIRVVSATYGGNCGAPYGNATGHLAAVCEGKTTCDYIIDSRSIGDPAYGCPKDYVAEWQCGDNPEKLGTSVGPEAGYGKRIVLRCPVRR